MLGYCTNVQSGNTFQEVLSNIKSIYEPICKRVPHNVGIGLWLSNQATLDADTLQLKEALEECNVSVTTMNGFPYYDFHAKVVQHQVYSPNWCNPERLSYTKRLASIFSKITSNQEVGISTLPLGWDSDSFNNADAANAIEECILFLEELEQQSGVCVHLDLETEPGCRLQLASDVSSFINEYFGDDERTRRYLRVCHDTCHGAVMHENVEEMVAHYTNAGLRIGKVQLSCAIEVDFKDGQRSQYAKELERMIEPRYLHQTTVQRGDTIEFHENLSKELLIDPKGIWRIHFHVPIHMQKIGLLCTTQKDLLRSIPVLLRAGATNWEVETYTWDVIPVEMHNGDLRESIAKELEWAASHINI